MTENTEIESSSMMETEQRKRKKWDCLFCYKPVGNDRKNIECTESMFTSCFQYLPCVIGKPKTFDEFKNNNGPFCDMCFEYAQQLSQKNDLLTTVQNEINDFVSGLTCSILQNRISPINTPFHYESKYILIQHQNEQKIDSMETETEADEPGSPVGVFDCYEEEVKLIEGQHRDLTSGVEVDVAVAAVIVNDTANTPPVENKPIMKKIVMQKSATGKMVMTIPCECGMSFENVELLKEHTFSCTVNKFSGEIDASQTQVRFRCGVCGFLARTIERLGKHKKRHMKIYPCKECSEKFPKKVKLIEHIESAHRQRQPVFKCLTCDMTFTSKRILGKHETAHKGQKKDNEKACEVVEVEHKEAKKQKTKRSLERKCDLCGQVFKSKTHLNYHMISKHTDKMPYECKVCSRKFKIRRFLDNHMQTHLTVKDFLCVECGKSFPNLINLKKHTKLEHSEDNFKCEYCGFKSLVEKKLAAHKAHFHDLSKKFACEICGVRVSTSSTLRTHEKIHTGEKPFKCNTCGESFRAATYLKIHTNRMHSDGKFKCTTDNCDFVAGSQYMLHMHTTVHTNDKPFSCEYCGKTYKTHWATIQHQRESCKV